MTAGAAAGEQKVIDGLLGAIGALHLKPVDWRAELLGSVDDAGSATEQATPAESPAPEGIAATELQMAFDTATSTACDGRQRAIDVAPRDLEDLLALRLAVRDALAASASDSPLRRVLPWIWRLESKGEPLTDSGRELGMELRVSRYATPRY